MVRSHPVICNFMLLNKDTVDRWNEIHTRPAGLQVQDLNTTRVKPHPQTMYPIIEIRSGYVLCNVLIQPTRNMHVADRSKAKQYARQHRRRIERDVLAIRFPAG